MIRRDFYTAAGFLSERRDFLHVSAAPSASGAGWDVLLRVDGTYADERDAEAAAIELRGWMDRLRDVETDGRIWWHGPTDGPAVPSRVVTCRSIGEAPE